MLKGADVAPVHLVGVGVEVVAAEGLKAGQHPVDLGLPADEGFEGGFPVPARLLGAEFVARAW